MDKKRSYEATRSEQIEQLSYESGKNKFFSHAAIICSSGSVVVAVLGLLGWIPSLAFLGNISPHFIPMAPTTSICFILLGLIVLIQVRDQLRGWSKFSAVTVAVLLSLFGIMEFAELFHTGIDIEDFFIPDAGMLGSMRKARMSPATGATFFFSGVATLLVLLRETRKKQVKRICSCAGIVGSFVTITGITILMSYLYKNPLLYGSQTIPMAVTTAIGFVFLGVGLVAVAGPDHMPVRLLVGSSSRARLLRVFLPLSILTVLSQNILRRSAFVSSHIDSGLLEVLLLMFFAAITGVVVTVVAGVIGRALDIAEEKIEALSKFPSEDPNPVLRVNRKGAVLYRNAAAERISEGIGCLESDIYKILPDNLKDLIAKTLDEDQPLKYLEVTVSDRIYSYTFAPVVDAQYVNLYGRDITKRKNRETKLSEYKDQLRSLISELTMAEDRERKNIASLLHDGVLQKLALSNMKLGMLRETLTSSSQLEALDNIRDHVGEMFKDMRSLTFDLCPPILYDIGLEAAVRDWLQREVADRHGIAVGFEAEEPSPQLDEDLRVALYRTIREVLMNVIKHAQAQNVKVTVSNLDDTVKVEVQDDGIGFEPAGTHEKKGPSGGLGLFTIRERLEHFGGSLEIESEPGNGSRVILTVPLTDQEEPIEETD